MHLVRYREAIEALMATPPSLPRGVRSGRRRGARASSRRAARRPRLARSDRGHAPARGLFDSDRAGAARARCRGGGRRGGAAAGRRIDGGRQDSLARHRAQVRGRRRAAQPRQRSAPCARRPPTSWRGREAARPDARITGVTIHPMVLRPKARELIAGIADDPTFGPVVVFGRGGTAVEVINDKALALPPLDLQDGARADRAHPRVARAQGLSRRAGRRRECDRARAGQARAARRRPAGGARARPQSAARRRGRGHRASTRGSRSRRSTRPAAGRAVIRASPSGPIRRNGSGASRCATGRAIFVGRSGRRTSRCTGRSLRRSPRRTCACASSRR